MWRLGCQVLLNKKPLFCWLKFIYLFLHVKIKTQHWIHIILKNSTPFKYLNNNHDIILIYELKKIAILVSSDIFKLVFVGQLYLKSLYGNILLSKWLLGISDRAHEKKINYDITYNKVLWRILIMEWLRVNPQTKTWKPSLFLQICEQTNFDMLWLQKSFISSTKVCQQVFSCFSSYILSVLHLIQQQ